jgi:hypothetical protein
MPIPGGNSCLWANAVESQNHRAGPRIEAAVDKGEILETPEERRKFDAVR